jgi:hypothetical protein
MILKYRRTSSPDKVILLTDDIHGIEHQIWIYHKDMIHYMDTQDVEKSFPYLTQDERDLIVTGYTPEQWQDFLKNPK